MLTSIADIMVEIEGRRVPAVNIQVEGVPGFLPIDEVTTMWFGVYFEVMFEDGSLWVVDQGSEEFGDHNQIKVDVHKEWAKEHDLEPDITHIYKDWAEFLEAYDAKVR